ncbi:hypothetical protein E3O06_05625 [Cryobacterium glaciale]|uniref:Uncharacterized protein n=1 Tax=Cryobacterium glaciale TaxID=1259145 RepID=A0A4R8V1U0_9MICO|nr:hypothetical protein [Cryobacterium glaciale]TFB75305.1 hypothetical protein E3O06_05625 [Cryobacterium glaciale]
MAAVVMLLAVSTVVQRAFGPPSTSSKAELLAFLVIAFATAVLCIDAARVITSTEVNERLNTAYELVSSRQVRLDRITRSLPSYRWLIGTGIASVIILMLLPTAAQLVFQPDYASPETAQKYFDGLGNSVDTTLGIAVAMLLVRCFNFGLGLLVLLSNASSGPSKWKRKLMWFVITVPGALVIVAMTVDSEGSPLAFLVIVTLSNTIVYLALLRAWLQFVREEDPRHPRLTFGLHGLFRLVIARMYQGLIEGVKEDVKWLESVADRAQPALTQAVAGPAVPPPRSPTRNWYGRRMVARSTKHRSTS